MKALLESQDIWEIMIEDVSRWVKSHYEWKDGDSSAKKEDKKAFFLNYRSLDEDIFQNSYVRDEKVKRVLLQSLKKKLAVKIEEFKPVLDYYTRILVL